MIIIFLLALAQNITFSLVSRSRNRNHINYHIFASILSNSVWFATFRYLVISEMNWVLFVPYTFGTVIGSVMGVKVSMWIEKIFNIK